MDKSSSERSAAKKRSATKRKKIDLFGSDAAMEAYLKSSRMPRISVEGYDTSVPQEDIKKALTDHFALCGEVFNVIFSQGRVGRAFVILRGDGAEEKALQLDGSDVGGWSARVKVTPEEDEETRRYRATLTRETHEDRRFRFGITVEGYDTSVPADELKSTLIEHFSSCGEITHVFINTLDSMAHVYFVHKDREDKALQLDGSEVKCYYRN
ncbi:unnamed protein product [Thlaspi arvense]|uniref:RRM domain-containing protein n=1 Tax=Thlaspi arvense TaxID=13288 RepID=A0AAU9RN04_THLAR|nr:unnamed protein product [Thlaspi arvense]